MQGLGEVLEWAGDDAGQVAELLLDFVGFVGAEVDLPIAVYLDWPSTTEALADCRATVMASFGRRGADARGGELDTTVAALADQVDGYLGVLAYLARAEADLVHAKRPGIRPARRRRQKRETDIWLVGYSE